MIRIKNQHISPKVLEFLVDKLYKFEIEWNLGNYPEENSRQLLIKSDSLKQGYVLIWSRKYHQQSDYKAIEFLKGQLWQEHEIKL